MADNADDVILQEHANLNRITYHGWSEMISAKDTTVGQFIEQLIRHKPHVHLPVWVDIEHKSKLYQGSVERFGTSGWAIRLESSHANRWRDEQGTPEDQMTNHWFYDEKDGCIHLRSTYPGHLVKSVYRAFDSAENITTVDLGSAVADFSKGGRCSSPAFIVIGPDSGNYYGYTKREGEDWKYVLHQEATAGWLRGYRKIRRTGQPTGHRSEVEIYRLGMGEFQKAADRSKIEVESYRCEVDRLRKELFEIRCEYELALNNNRILYKDLDSSRADVAKIQANLDATLDEYHKVSKQCEVMGCRMDAMSMVLSNREEEIKKLKMMPVESAEALVEVTHTRKRTAMIWTIALLAAALVGQAVPKVAEVLWAVEWQE